MPPPKMVQHLPPFINESMIVFNHKIGRRLPNATSPFLSEGDMGTTRPALCIFAGFGKNGACQGSAGLYWPHRLGPKFQFYLQGVKI